MYCFSLFENKHKGAQRTTQGDILRHLAHLYKLIVAIDATK